MRLSVTAIQPAGPDARARRIVFAQGESRTTAAAVIRALGLEAGDEVAESEFIASLEALEPDCARERALRVVGYRERSTRELERRLVDDGYPAGIAREVVSRFVELGLVDDARFAGLWARSRALAGYGASRIVRELREKGVAPEMIEDAVSEVVGGDSEGQRARALIGDRPPQSAQDRERLIRKLVRRGFTFSVALGAVPQVERGADLDDKCC